MDTWTPNCKRCVKRPREEGGKGTCPLGPSVRLLYEKRGDGNDCSHYLPGDRKPKPEPVLPEEGLF